MRQQFVALRRVPLQWKHPSIAFPPHCLSPRFHATSIYPLPSATETHAPLLPVGRRTICSATAKSPSGSCSTSQTSDACSALRQVLDPPLPLCAHLCISIACSMARFVAPPLETLVACI